MAAKNWADVRSEAVAAGLVDEEEVARLREAMRDQARAYRLAEIRKGQQVSQKTLAEGMHVSQARISTIERGRLARTELGTLQSYVEALGGHLTVVADFGDHALVVRD